MMNWKMKGAGLVASFLRDESGQSTTEYILILVAVVMVAIKFKTTFGNQMNTIVGQVTGQIQDATAPTQ